MEKEYLHRKITLVSIDDAQYEQLLDLFFWNVPLVIVSPDMGITDSRQKIIKFLEIHSAMMDPEQLDEMFRDYTMEACEHLLVWVDPQNIIAYNHIRIATSP